MSWFKRAPKAESVPIERNLGIADIEVVENDGVAHHVRLKGSVIQHNSTYFGTLYFTAQDMFEQWQNDGGKTGMLRIADGTYVPVCNVKKVTVKYSDYVVTV